GLRPPPPGRTGAAFSKKVCQRASRRRSGRCPPLPEGLPDADYILVFPVHSGFPLNDTSNCKKHLFLFGGACDSRPQDGSIKISAVAVTRPPGVEAKT